jgi:Carboxypeptidase regulatory-like domain
MVRKPCLWALSCLVLLPALSFAQQTGAVTGKAVDTAGLVLPGVTVEARSVSLPAPRLTVTGGAGQYQLPALQPGVYTLTFELSGMNKVTKEVMVQLSQETVVDVTMSVQGVSETVTVTAAIVPMIERDSTAIKSGVSFETIQSVPVGQEYRDLIKLIPGVQYTQDTTRGPSAGGSGQDNVYKFDGVNVTLPLFGTLSAEPASHDVSQVTTIKGGAKAVDFDRAGGFTVDSVSKSGTAKFSGMLSYQLQSKAMTADLTSASLSQYKEDRGWLTVNLGGPVIPRKAYFYGSYYRPTRSRANASNLYGPLPGYESVRNEGFGKLTITPISQMLLNVSWRQSHRLDTGSTFGSSSTSTTGSGSEAWQKIAIVEGSWILNSRSFATFKYTHFENPTQGRPDNVADVQISTAVGTKLDVNNFDKIGLLSVPTPVAGATAFNAFVQPLIDRYGYTLNGVKTGGGSVGYGTLFDKDDFFRDQAQVAFNTTLGTDIRHDIHAGLQWYVDSEDLTRSSNGWGWVTVPGGRAPSIGINGIPAYYMAAFQQQSTGAVPAIHSEYRSLNIEVNDTINFKNLSVNFGVLMSRDKLYGQGLREDSSALSGYTKADGNTYLMYTVPFAKSLQPRVGATWSYNGKDTIYASFAQYLPAASSLPRAASWARNLAVTINAYFDANGVLYGVQNLAGSSGKLFVPDMAPRQTDEYLIGTAKQFEHGITGRVYYRYRYGSHFWEDTNNNARVVYNPPAGIPRTLYIPDLTAKLDQIGSGSTYVVAELDGAYTKYHEATAEAEWRTRKSYVRLSYTWARYRGNFDQDNTTTGNDANVFIGSSFIGDAAGRQLWDNRNGTLRGDRPLMLKLYGYYQLPWWASVGAYVIAQSGQPWEKWSYEPYIALTTSVSDASRYAEPAGSRRTPTHYQLDMNYTQDFKVQQRFRFQVAVDLFNVFNKQTGYSYDPGAHSSTFGQPRAYFSPRKAQIAARFQF